MILQDGGFLPGGWDEFACSRGGSLFQGFLAALYKGQGDLPIPLMDFQRRWTIMSMKESVVESEWMIGSRIMSLVCNLNETNKNRNMSMRAYLLSYFTPSPKP